MPLVQFARADSALALRSAAPESILFEISDLLPSGSRGVPDSLQRVAALPLGAKSEWGCGEEQGMAAVIERARCALGTYSHYVELRSFVVHDSSADVAVFVLRPAPGPTRKRGIRETVTSTLARAIGQGSAVQGPLSFDRYVAHLTLTATGDWLVREMVRPEAPTRAVFPDSGARASQSPAVHLPSVHDLSVDAA